MSFDKWPTVDSPLVIATADCLYVVYLLCLLVSSHMMYLQHFINEWSPYRFIDYTRLMLKSDWLIAGVLLPVEPLFALNRSIILTQYKQVL